MYKKLTALSLSLMLALTAALCFSSAPAQAAGQTYTVGNTVNGNWALYYNQHGQNIAPNEILSSNNTGTRAVYKVPLQLSVRNPNAGYGQYATGVLTWNVYWSPDTRIDNGAGEWSFDLDYPFASGEGYSWSFRPHGVRSGTIVVILDNYSCSTYGVPGPDWNLLFNVVSSSAPTWGLGYDAYTFMATTVSGSVNLSDTATGSLADVIASSINSSSSIQDILSILNAISGNTALLQSVVNKMDNISGVLANVYSQLQQGNSYLNSLGWALAGIDIQAADGATVSQEVYDRWVSIIKKALDDQAPDTSEQESQLDNANQQLSDQEALESDAYQFSGDNIAAIDWNMQVPDQIAGAALVIMAMVSRIWDKLGILQFAVTAACTVGLVTIVLGVVNRFSSIRARGTRASNKGDIDKTSNKTN